MVALAVMLFYSHLTGCGCTNLGFYAAIGYNECTASQLVCHSAAEFGRYFRGADGSNLEKGDRSAG
jgi:hypothetical protein